MLEFSNATNPGHLKISTMPSLVCVNRDFAGLGWQGIRIEEFLFASSQVDRLEMGLDGGSHQYETRLEGYFDGTQVIADAENWIHGLDVEDEVPDNLTTTNFKILTIFVQSTIKRRRNPHVESGFGSWDEGAENRENAT